MNAAEMEQVLQKLDKRFSVSDNPDRPGLSNIFFEGKNYDLPVISSNDIRVEPDASYVYEFPNGLRARFWSKGEILGRVEDFLKRFKEGKIENSLYEDKR